MTQISQGQFSGFNTNAHYDKIYESLTQRANEVKPNQSKAKLVAQNPIENAITSVVDTYEDGKNFVRAVKTGKVGDNSLGRINDLGLKAGALLIASFLATHAKTKTDAIMQFIGGGAFIASMSLWPKLFINLPARIIHGFPVDRKYISAQGDKKDFGLDNQFIVWDCIPDEVLRKDAQRAGIDFDAPNGKEKIQRKEQKTMLQTRTLNLATVGFGAPLMTSLFGNFVEPKVRDLVVKHDVSRASNILNDSLKKYLGKPYQEGKQAKKAPTIIRNEKEIKNLFKKYSTENGVLDDEFFKKLASLFDFTDIAGEFKDSDNMTPLRKFSTRNVVEELKALYETQGVVEKQSLQNALENFSFASFDDIFSEDIIGNSKNNIQKASEIIEQLQDNFTIENVKKVLKQNGVQDGELDSFVKKLKVDISTFDDIIRDYNKGIFAQTRGRLKAYLGLLNPVIGSKAESAYTKDYTDTMNGLFKALGIKDTKALKDGTVEDAQNFLINLFSKKLEGIQYGSDEYKEMIANLSIKGIDPDIRSLVQRLAQSENIKEIHAEGIAQSELAGLDKAVFGEIGEKSGLMNLLQQFINIKTTDLNSIKSKALVCANFEARLNAGEFANFTKEELNAARQMIYNGSASYRFNFGFMRNHSLYERLVNTIFNPQSFETEESILPGIKGTIESLRDKLCIKDKLDFADGTREFAQGTQSEKYALANSFSSLVKSHATKLQNNKSWLKMFGSMAIILVGATLLIQPFFGKIDKEFSKKDEKRGV